MADNYANAQVVKTFPFQSYFDSVKLEKAINDSPPGSTIIPSTGQVFDMDGYGVSLDPASESPVAIEFISSWGGNAGTLVLKPGQTQRPGFQFKSIRWGLPKGWLGGGLVILNVIRAPTGDVRYIGSTREIAFHRARLVIEAEGVALPALRRNWPSRFPWTQAIKDVAISQKSGPVMTVNPTRTLIRLRSNPVAAQPSLRFYFRNTYQFDSANDGSLAAAPADPASYWTDLVFPMNTGVSTGSFPVAELPPLAAAMACDEGGVTVTDLSGGGLVGAFIDVIRLGVLG
jgi:hypothetical protein